MEKILKSIFVAGLLIVGIQISASAQTLTPGITDKQVEQELKIKQGLVSGELTRREAKVLKREQNQVKLMKKVAKADGKVTRKERKAIRRKQKSADKHIYRQKHDGQSRY